MQPVQRVVTFIGALREVIRLQGVVAVGLADGAAIGAASRATQVPPSVPRRPGTRRRLVRVRAAPAGLQDPARDRRCRVTQEQPVWV